MNPNQMTGEPNQQNPTSVFGFDSYPPLFPVNWSQSNPFTNNGAHYGVPVPSEHHQLFTTHQGPSFPSTFDSSQLGTQIPVNSSMLSTQIQNSAPPEHVNSFGHHISGFSFGTPRPTQEIVQFPFQTNNACFGAREIGCKRKTDSPPLQPVKQHITEEKMAEHMSKLHISSETVLPKENNSSRMQRLYMCEEMRKLQTESILPHTLISKIQRPCTALVLWKPPTRLIPPLTNNEIDQTENNNKDSVPDHNKSENSTNEAEMNEVSLSNMDLDTC